MQMTLDLGLPALCPVTVINLWEHITDCTLCGAACSLEYGIAVNEYGDIIDGSAREEWVGMTVCRTCFERANEGQVTRIW